MSSQRQSDQIREALFAAREVSEDADGAVCAFLEHLEENYTGDMEVEHSVAWLAQYVRWVS